MIRIKKLEMVTGGDSIPGPASIQQKVFPILGVRSNGVDFTQDAFNFLLIGSVHEFIVGCRICGMNCNLSSRNQCTAHLIQSCLSSLHQRNGHFRVINRLF